MKFFITIRSIETSFRKNVSEINERMTDLYLCQRNKGSVYKGKGTHMKDLDSRTKLAFGISIGLIFGTIFDNLSMGLVLGTALGIIWGHTDSKEKK